ncbi:MAG: DUF4010 domain-containing protein, partial [Polyangiaceae bacterium]
VGSGAALALRRGVAARAKSTVGASRNPLELRAAMLFMTAFVVVLVLSRLTIEHLGHGGLYGLAALTGLSDVDPFVLGIAQSSSHAESVHVAAVAIAIAAAANNVAKGIYALVLGDRATGRLSLGLLALLAALGLLPLVWL